MMTEREISEAKSAAAALLGKIGGPARAKALTPERRTEIARKAAAARWGKGQPDPDPDPTGTEPSNVRSLAKAAEKRGRKLSPPAQPTSAAEAGRKGGRARAAALTAEYRGPVAA